MKKLSESQFLNSRAVIILFRIIVGTVFIYASLDKIAYPNKFAIIVSNYNIFPKSLSLLIAFVLPWIELIVGSCLIAGYKISISSRIALGLLIVFFIAICIMGIKGDFEDCGCFAKESFLSTSKLSHALLRDFIIILFSFFIVLGNDIQRRHNNEKQKV